MTLSDWANFAEILSAIPIFSSAVFGLYQRREFRKLRRVNRPGLIGG